MRKIFLLTLCLILWSIYPSAEEFVDYGKVSLAHNIFNFHIVAPNVMRGSQPPEEAFRMLKNHYNVKTILNLRDDKQHNEREREVVEKLGMNFINIPMNGSKKQSIEKIEKCLSIINNESNKPIFVHCQAGKDRTGLIFAAYRIKYDNWSFKDAFTEMLAYGYDRVRCFNLEKSLIEWNNWRESHSKLISVTHT